MNGAPTVNANTGGSAINLACDWCRTSPATPAPEIRNATKSHPHIICMMESYGVKFCVFEKNIKQKIKT